jgi:hypothetical protein
MGLDYLLFWVPPALTGLTVIVVGLGVATGKLSPLTGFLSIDIVGVRHAAQRGAVSG